MFFNSCRFVSVSSAALMALSLSALLGCGGGGGGGGGAFVGVNPGPATGNVLAVRVDSGPGGNNVNRLYTSVTICAPGGGACQTIDPVLVDTGSTGLRVLASALSPALRLPAVPAANGQPLINCAKFIDNSYVWGPVVRADVQLAGKGAANLPVQVIADAAFAASAATCSPAGNLLDTPGSLGANAIIGLGIFKEDCGAACETVTNNGVYFTCSNAACSVAGNSRASLAAQLKNPVILFASDNNGIVVDLPGVGPEGAASLTGSLVFGIGTQSNNQFSGRTILATTPAGNFATQIEGRTLPNSFLDTGSNGLYFDSALIPACGPSAPGFYCPALTLATQAVQIGVNGIAATVSFFIANAVNQFRAPLRAVLPALAGPIGDTQTFDWGLPFFYGRRVFIGIEGQPSAIQTGPFYAY